LKTPKKNRENSMQDFGRKKIKNLLVRGLTAKWPFLVSNSRPRVSWFFRVRAGIPTLPPCYYQGSRLLLPRGFYLRFLFRRVDQKTSTTTKGVGTTNRVLGAERAGGRGGAARKQTQRNLSHTLTLNSFLFATTLLLLLLLVLFSTQIVESRC
jgi:hypothetical protein